MNKYEKLLQEAKKNGLSVDENYNFKGKLAGLYIDGNIALSDALETTTEKACVLAEELGHFHTSVGDIIDLSDVQNRKQERQARLWAYNKAIGLHGLVRAYEHGCRDRYETAEYLEVTDEFLQDAVKCYRDKYGVGKVVDNYYIMFIPNLQILKLI